MKDAQHHHGIVFDAVVHSVREPTGEGPSDVLVYHYIHLRGAVDALEHLLHAEEELGPEPCALSLIPGPCVDQVGLRFWADDHGTMPDCCCRRVLTSSQRAPACGSAW